MPTNKVIAGVVINDDDALLLIRVGDQWMLPGGQLDSSDELHYLQWIVGQQLPYLLLLGPQFCFEFDNHWRGSRTRTSVYRASFVGDLTLGRGVAAAGWHSCPEYFNLSRTAGMVVEKLRQRGILPPLGAAV